MGFGMATHLVAQGFTVKGYDISAQTLSRFTAAGGIPTSTLTESAHGSPYYVCMVATAQQLKSLLFEGEGEGALVNGKDIWLRNELGLGY